MRAEGASGFQAPGLHAPKHQRGPCTRVLDPLSLCCGAVRGDPGSEEADIKEVATIFRSASDKKPGEWALRQPESLKLFDWSQALSSGMEA